MTTRPATFTVRKDDEPVETFTGTVTETVNRKAEAPKNTSPGFEVTMTIPYSALPFSAKAWAVTTDKGSTC